MDELHTAYTLRVHRKNAGKLIPFDRITFFHKDDQDLLPRIYRDAMVLPITAAFASQIVAATASTADTVQHKAYSFARFGERELCAQLKEHNPVAEIMDQRSDYLALIPVLFTKTGSKLVRAERFKGRKKVATFAAYLVARPTKGNTVNLTKKVLSAKSYFILDGKIVRPLCLACPRHQSFFQGLCHLGEQQCYQRLARAKPADLVRGMTLYEELMKRITEPQLELQEVAQ
jgi:hypothetical protein